MHGLGISLPHEDGFSKVKTGSIKSAYDSICDDDDIDADETWMHGDWFYLTGYGIFGHEVKATKRSPPDELTRWIITQPKGFIIIIIIITFILIQEKGFAESLLN